MPHASPTQEVRAACGAPAWAVLEAESQQMRPVTQPLPASPGERGHSRGALACRGPRHPTPAGETALPGRGPALALQGKARELGVFPWPFSGAEGGPGPGHWPICSAGHHSCKDHATEALPCGTWPLHRGQRLRTGPAATTADSPLLGQVPTLGGCKPKSSVPDLGPWGHW